MEKVQYPSCRRWCVLTENYLFTFKEPKAYENPTESVALDTIANISKSDEETHRQFSFVSGY